MKLEKTVFRGSGTALVTPLCRGGIDFPALGELIDWQIASGTDALIVAGTTGEAPTLTEAEKMALIKYTVEKTAGRVPVIAGTGSNNTQYAVKLSKYAEEAGADGLLVITPYYNKTSQAGIVAHFSAIADATDLPLIIYHIPSRTGVKLSVSTFETLSHHPRIVGVKEASSDIGFLMELFAACGDTLSVYAGNDDQIYPILALGGDGVISVVSNILPQLTHQLCQSYFDGNTEMSRATQFSLMPMIRTLFSEVNPIPVKEALYQMDLIRREYRLPLFPLDAGGANRVRAMLRRFRLLLEHP